MSIYIENEYDKPINIAYEDIITKVIDGTIDFINCPFECEVNVTIVDNNHIHSINKLQRNIDSPTDVLSFPLIDYEKEGDFSLVEDNLCYFNPDSGELMLGDIVISYDKVIEQANEYNHSLEREIAFLTVHSMLHLFGFDHMDDDQQIVMEEYQNKILNNLNFTREN